MNPISKRDDNQYVEFKIAQKALNKEMMTKEQVLSCLQANKSVLDSMIYSGNRTVESKHWTLLLQASFSYC